MKIKYKVLISVWIIIALICLFFSIYIYDTNKTSLLSGIDEKLYTSVVMLRAVVGADYHDNLSLNSFTSEEYGKIIVDRNNKLCDELGLQYLWSNMMVNGKIVFTTSTSPGHDVTKQDYAKFFDVHGDPHAFDNVFSTMKPDYSSFHNEWGDGRMVLVPYVDKNNRPYVFGASISTNEVNMLSSKILINSVLFSIVLFLFGFVVSFMLARLITKPIEKTIERIKKFSKGELDHEESNKKPNRDETGVLATAFEEMATKVNVTTKQSKISQQMLSNKIEELEKINKLMVGRELKMAELKKKIEESENK